jgi:hypothetical protein
LRIGDRRQETGDRRQETGDRRQETGVRSQESGVRSQEIADLAYRAIGHFGTVRKGDLVVVRYKELGNDREKRPVPTGSVGI